MFNMKKTIVSENSLLNIEKAINNFIPLLDRYNEYKVQENHDTQRINTLERELDYANARVRELTQLKNSLATKERIKELEERERKLKETEALAYNKGYAAGYIDITKKMGNLNGS